MFALIRFCEVEDKAGDSLGFCTVEVTELEVTYGKTSALRIGANELAAFGFSWTN